MYEFGGLYADLDFECLKPLDKIMSEHECILSEEPLMHAYLLYGLQKLVSNALMACRPRHYYFESLINRLDYPAPKKTPLFTTGPIMFDKAYNEIIKKSKEILCHDDDLTGSGSKEQFKECKDDPFLAAPDIFQPKVDPRSVTSFKKKCSDKLRKRKDHKYNFIVKVCGRLKGHYENGPQKSSLTIHHWTHMWSKIYKNDKIYGAKQIPGTFSIKDIFK